MGIDTKFLPFVTFFPGIRRPYLLRVASLAVLMIGLTTKFSSAGTLPSMTPISVPEAPKDLYWSGSRVGTRTYSMISYQNAPQSHPCRKNA